MHPVNVLLVEDNPGDEFLVSLIVSDAPVPVTLHVARDGAEALSKLADPGFSSSPCNPRSGPSSGVWI